MSKGEALKDNIWERICNKCKTKDYVGSMYRTKVWKTGDGAKMCSYSCEKCFKELGLRLA